MKKFRLTSETEIINYEEQYLQKCKNIIEKIYDTRIRAYGCEIRYGLFWTNNIRNKTYKERPTLCHLYTCWFGYGIYKNDKIICYDKVEGYTLGASSGFLYIKKKNNMALTSKYLEVTYVDDFSDLIEDLNNDFIILEKLFNDWC